MPANHFINLISDTVTKPSQQMLAYMMNAETGDDVFGEDPTVRALEEKVARMFNKEAAIFCPSGTMTNQIAIKVHTKPLDEVICDHFSHIYQYEVGGYAYHSGVAINPLIGTYGKLNAVQIKEAIKPTFDWLPKTKLVVLENSTNKGGGNYYTIDEIKPITALCKEQNLGLHLDGARLFNVLVETNEKTEDYGDLFDSISICLSKGLACPVGSVLIGSFGFIQEARRVRKVMGGGMRQAGILAAAGIYALDHHIPLLKTDNDRAKKLAIVLSNCKFVETVLPVKTNIIIFTLTPENSVETILNRLKENKILATAFGHNAIRFVLHMDITETMINEITQFLKL